MGVQQCLGLTAYQKTLKKNSLQNHNGIFEKSFDKNFLQDKFDRCPKAVQYTFKILKREFKKKKQFYNIFIEI